VVLDAADDAGDGGAFCDGHDEACAGEASAAP